MKTITKLICLASCLLLNMSAFAAEVVTIGGLKYELNGSEAYVAGYEGSPTDVVIPETVESEGLTFRVTRIGNNAFQSCNSITSLTTTGYNLKHILFEAFRGCTNLQRVILLGVVKIDFNVFYDCNNLSLLFLGDGMELIGNNAFRGCAKLTYVVIPKTCLYTSSVGGGSYNHGSGDRSWDNQNNVFSGCSRLQSIIYLGDQNSQCGSNATIYHPKDQIQWSSTLFDYQGKAPTATFTCDMPAGFKVTSYEMPTLEKSAGSYTQNVPFTFANNDMSFDIEIPYEYTINPVTLKAKVSDGSRLYGDADPDFSSTYTGFVNNEDVSVVTSHGSYTTTATAKSDVGTYVIKQTGATAQNYVFEYEDGTLTVDKAPLTMTANDKTISYGGTIPTFDANYEGLKNNERQPVWTTQPTISTTATSTTKVGTYPITISDADAKNYQLTINNGTLTIEKADLKVIIDNKSRFYGEANPELTYYYSGLKNNETEPEWEKQPIIETTADIKSNVGTYPIRINNAVAVNYNVTATDGALTIKKCQLKVATKDYTRAYGEENPEFELFYTGFVNNEDESVLVAKPKATTTATANTDVGVYDITVSNGVAENYDFSYSGGKLTIEKAYQTLTWDQDFSDVKKFDQVELLATVSSGLDVTYSIEGEQTCIIFKIGSKQYLNCESGGEVVVAAIQEGNKNYWQTTKIYKTIVIKPLSAINGHEYVDLGLPSGKCWAYTDYGSTVPEGYGTYLNWKDNSIISSKWGSDWTTPSIEDIRELENNCTWEWSTRTGRNGYTVKGKNGNSIFLPANGCLMKGQQFSTKVGEWVYYWSSTKSGDMANIMMCTSSDVWYGEMNTTMTKLPIRPITKSMSSDIREGVASSDNNSPEIIGIYDLQGHKLDDLGKGMNIVKMSNGTTKKIFVK